MGICNVNFELEIQVWDKEATNYKTKAKLRKQRPNFLFIPDKNKLYDGKSVEYVNYDLNKHSFTVKLETIRCEPEDFDEWLNYWDNERKYELIEKPFQIVHMEGETNMDVISLRPIGKYRGNVGRVNMRLKDFEEYLNGAYSSKKGLAIEAKYVLKDGFWTFKELV